MGAALHPLPRAARARDWWSATRCAVHGTTPASDLRTGEALRAPALDPDRLLAGRAHRRPGVRAREAAGAGSAASHARGRRSSSSSAAGRPDSPPPTCCAARATTGAVTMVSADASPPCDRPNLSKDYLAGTAPEDWIPLRPPEYYTRAPHRSACSIRRVTRIDRARSDSVRARRRTAAAVRRAAARHRRRSRATDDSRARPTRRCTTCARFADSRAIVARAARPSACVVVGASFIGLEVAASLRARGIEVTSSRRTSVPMERVLGAELGRFVQRCTRRTASLPSRRRRSRRDRRASRSRSASGASLEADFVVARRRRAARVCAGREGRPRDRSRRRRRTSICETSAPGVFAAGDIARWPDPHTGERIRVEHWVVAERQGQMAAQQHARPRASPSTPCRSSGASTTTWRSTTSATPRRWDAIDIDGIARRARLQRHLQARRRHAGGGDDRTRSGRSGGGTRDGAGNSLNSGQLAMAAGSPSRMETRGSRIPRRRATRSVRSRQGMGLAIQ